MVLTPNFTLDELVASEAAIRHGFDEQFSPSADVVWNLRMLAMNLLQPLRNYIAMPLHITSGYRCERVNTAVGGSKTSDHLFGRAADINLVVNGEENNLLLAGKLLETRIPFKQLIFEFGTRGNPAWIHVSYEQHNNIREIFVATKQNQKTVYIPMTFPEAQEYCKLAA